MSKSVARGPAPSASARNRHRPGLLARLATSVVALAFSSSVFAVAGNYAFSTATDESLTDMTGATQLLAGNIDDTASALTAIGFDFYFQGTRHTQFSVNENGVLRLGAAAQGGSPYQPLGQAAIPIITAYGADQRTHTTGRVHYRVVGSAPNRALVVEWLNNQSNFNAGGTADLTYQVRLFETTGAIELVYGGMTMSSVGAADANSQDPHIGFSSGNTIGSVGFVTAPAAGAPTFTSNTAAATGVIYAAGPITALTSAGDGSRRVFAFDPPPVDVAPSGISFTGTTALQTTINWNDNASNELGYLIERSTDGGTTYVPFSSQPANATTVVDATLTPNTTYHYRVRAFTEGALSAPTTASLTSLAPGLVQSTAAGGPWSNPGTWAGGTVPLNSDFVTIADGAIVTIDTAAVAYSLNVGGGGGTAAHLLYEAATARSLTVGGDVTIAPNGSFRSADTGSVVTHTLSLGGNLTNAGELDFSTVGNVAGAGIVFTGAGNVVFGGNGATDLRALTVNKATAATVTLSPGVLTVRGLTSGPDGFLTLTSGTLHVAGTFTASNPLFTVAGYSIPAAAGLTMDNPNYTVTGANGSGTVAGRFTMRQGTYNIGTAAGNSLGFSAGAVITVEGGIINAAGRFGVAVAGNAISYNQTGGTITVATVGNTAATASFDMGTGAASQISISGGGIVVQTHSTNATPRDYRHQAGAAGTTTVTGGTVQFGNAASGAAVRTFNAAGVLPHVLVSSQSANHSLVLGTPSGFNNITRDITIQPGATFNIGNNVFLFNGTALVNNGTLTANGASSNFVWFRADAPITYSGSGAATAPITSMAIQADAGLTFDPAVTPIVANAVRLFGGSVFNAGKITVGNGGTTTAVVQIGNTTTPTAAGTFDQPLGFNPGSGGVTLSYLRTMSSRTTGNEIPPARTLTSLTYDDNDPTHSLTIAGGDISVANSLALTNGRIVTGANTLIAAAATTTVTRTNGYVDGNLRKTLATAVSRTFEVGSANGYSPVVFNVTAGTFPATITASARQGVLGTMPVPAAALGRYWNLQAGDITADLTFTYLDPADLPSLGNEADMTVYRSDGGTATSVGGSINTGANTATIAGVSTFSDWTLGAAVPAALQVAPTTLDFGGVDVGSISTAQTVTLSNTGTEPLDVTALDAAAAPFARSGGSCSATTPFTLAGGASCTLAYTFVPGTAGAATQTLALVASVPGDSITLQGNGLQGTLQIAGSPVDFGAVIVGDSATPVTVTLTNNGTASLDVTTLDAPSAPFSRSGGSCPASAPFALAVGASCSLQYGFSPTGTGAANQALAVGANAPGSGSIALSGNGVQGTLVIAGGNVDFGNVSVGDTSAAQTVTLSNSGTASLDVTALSVATAPFTRAGGSCAATLPISIAAGANCTIDYTFAPAATGAASQNLTVTANAPGGGSIQLAGNGIQGELTISGGSIDFGDVEIGNSAGVQLVTLTNDGDASLQITAIDAAAAPFSRSGGTCAGTTPFSIAAGSSCTLAFDFAPTAAGTASQTLAVAANAPGSGSISLTGNGTPAPEGNLTIAPDSYDFGAVQVGDSSALGTITLGNDGDASLEVSSLTLAAAPFVRTADGSCGNSLPITIAAGASCTLTYRFDPAATGVAQQVFTVGSDAPGETTFTLEGNGTPAGDYIFGDGFED